MASDRSSNSLGLTASRERSPQGISSQRRVTCLSFSDHTGHFLPPSFGHVSIAQNVVHAFFAEMKSTTLVQPTVGPIDMDREQKTRKSLAIRFGLLLVSTCLMVSLATILSSAPRNADQVAYVNGALQLARGEVRASGAPFYNYDKQYATYLMLAALLHLFPKTNPVWLSNLLDFALFALAALSITLYRRGSIVVPLAAFIPVILSPGLVLYAAFLGTSCVSYSILVCAFMVALLLPGRSGKFAAAPLVALAIASRADAILAIPAFILSIHSRQRVRSLIRDPAVLTLGLACALPIVAGRMIFTGRSVYWAGSTGFSTLLKAFTALIVFSFGLGECLLLLALAISYGVLALQKEHWRTYYTLTAFSMIIPLGFYSFQLFSPPYLFLELAVTLFFILNRRTAILWRHLCAHRHRLCTGVLVLSAALTAVPWFVGVDLPRLNRPRLTLLKPTTFPTNHGAFPMGAYGVYLWHLRQSNFSIDYNQKLWRSAETVDYRTCNNGDVPLFNSQGVTYLELAVRLQQKTPVIVKEWKKAPCGFMYVDSRSVTRPVSPLFHTQDLRDVLSSSIAVASRGNEGQLILLAETSKPQSLEGVILSELVDFFGGREFEVVFMPTDTGGVRFTPPYRYVIFTDGLSCSVRPQGKLLVSKALGHLKLIWYGEIANRPLSAVVSCPGATIVGWAGSVLPDYLYSSANPARLEGGHRQR